MFLHKFVVLLCVYKVYSLIDQIEDLEPENVFFDLTKAKDLFDDFIKTFGKVYDSKIEYFHRLNVFTKNLQNVNERNRRSGSMMHGITQFMDLTYEEFEKTFTGLGPLENLTTSNQTVEFVETVQKVPDSWDWRKQGVVTPVKNQMQCMSCWAFAAAAFVESQYAIKHGKLYSLSEQQLVDCIHNFICTKGYWTHWGFTHAAKMGGFMATYNYPYVGAKRQCKFNKNKITTKVRGGEVLRIHTEEQLKQLVHQKGPIPIALQMTNAASTYKGSVIATAATLDCNPRKNPNHAATIVGYGTENGVPFWIIKNSFGTNWGDQGYLKLIRGQKACSILDYITVADVF